MKKIHENTCKQVCSYVFKQANYIKAHVLMYFLQLVLTFTPHYIIMVKGLLGVLVQPMPLKVRGRQFYGSRYCIASTIPKQT